MPRKGVPAAVASRVAVGQAQVCQKLRCAEVSDPREDDFVGAEDVVRGLRDDDVVRLSCFGAEVTQRLDDAGEIARFVVDDCDHRVS